MAIELTYNNFLSSPPHCGPIIAEFVKWRRELLVGIGIFFITCSVNCCDYIFIFEIGWSSCSIIVISLFIFLLYCKLTYFVLRYIARTKFLVLVWTDPSVQYLLILFLSLRTRTMDLLRFKSVYLYIFRTNQRLNPYHIFDSLSLFEKNVLISRRLQCIKLLNNQLLSGS